eukprot:scaffold22350_cov124-Isochrysis_galbana.AAC.11
MSAGSEPSAATPAAGGGAGAPPKPPKSPSPPEAPPGAPPPKAPKPAPKPAPERLACGAVAVCREPAHEAGGTPAAADLAAQLASNA